MCTMVRLGLRLCFVLLLLGCGVEFELVEPSGGQGGDGSMSTSSSAGLGGSGGEGTGGQPTGSGAGGGDALPVCQDMLEIEPSVSDCINTSDPDPDDCQGLYPDELVIDRNELNTQAHHNAYLRFGPIAGVDSVTAVTLRMHTASTAFADSAQSGAVWIVQPFELATLFDEAPATVGSNAAAADEGSVGFGQVVEWQLPVGVIRRDGHVFLGVLPIDIDDGVRYERDGAEGPRLVVQCR